MRLDSLAPCLDRSGPWATAYVSTARATETSGEERRLTARAAGDELARQGASKATVEAVTEHLATLSPRAEPQGSAVFATEGEVVLEVPLTQAPDRAQVCWATLPHLGPLPELLGENPLCLTARIDRTGADFELTDAYGTRPAGQARGEEWPVHRTANGEFSEKHFQFRVENTWESNAGVIAEAVAARFAESGADVLLLSGDPRERRAVHDKLPEQLRQLAVETSHGGRAAGSSTELLDRETERIRQEYARRHTAEALTELRAAHTPGASPAGAAGGGVAEGVPSLVEAAREHRLDTLVVRPGGPDREREVWVGDGSDQLGVRRSELQYLGATDPSPARADDALLRNAVATDAEVLVVPPEDELPVGGLGALLRWTHGEPGPAA
ncbi:Vms1/Ankzf1 family peptidyl-tRNA hydrolase [Streptomyces albus]|uniref:baeRF2 domain-containing protein n=1 Tax=Streptomyces albus TaxID=1888 RepID=UPI0024AE45B7|nr:Vms1/Ankzf1 family peptidyl-tRNA hydrolase [Streptomyces albus]MDI6411755.1 Vms1/Ankzf1 family peptidyl-tRNA hydrolase [Streptomyces albus]